MKLFLIRYIKIAFTWLRLDIIFNLFAKFFLNLYYLTKFSRWAHQQRKVSFNDFPSKWDYNKRYELYKWVIEKENLSTMPVNYLEFGVASGYSFRWFAEQNKNTNSRFYGFDTFTGLPEDWGPYKKGAFGTSNKVPEINDSRCKFYQGIFQQTVPGFLKELNDYRRNVIMLDADLYSATLFA